ncbi:MAG: type II toxin-antitoxin system RelE/ParE family toxin [Chitinispirillia bacterium]|nr:type II toxin-antitoxin system RelE/ParE family toxin [Chitinispirillia bacterium]MCL2269621.1 type II toxin-antitoxin system RelE/ParE family toxin [Chitinispirillia bacterium]
MIKQIALYTEIKTPPLEDETRVEIGRCLRSFQNGEIPGAPMVKSVAQIGNRCYEIRYRTAQHNWRLYLAVRAHVVVLFLEDKKSDAVPKSTVEICKNRLKAYELAAKEFSGKNKGAL